jgi:hypothetical protein
VRDLGSGSVIVSWLMLDVAARQLDEFRIIQRLAYLMRHSKAIDRAWQSKSTFLVAELDNLSKTHPFITGASPTASALSLIIMVHSSQPRSRRSKSP